MDKYELTRATRMVQQFVIDDVSNWYVRRNRRRFWKGITDSEKIAAYQTLREVLNAVLTMIAPFTPFLAENLFQKLKVKTDPESIHLVQFSTESSFQDIDLERRMERAQIIVSLARSLREKSKIKIRQPLSKILIPISNPQERRDIAVVEDIICEELNVKGIEFISDDSGIVKRSAKANFKTLGKVFGTSTQKVANAIKELTNAQLKTLEHHGSLTLNIDDNEQAEIISEHVDIIHEDIEGWLVANQGVVTVALDTHLTNDLIIEGTAREIVNRIQTLRKDLKFEITDRIEIQYATKDDILLTAFSIMKDYICSETLAIACNQLHTMDTQSIDINGATLQLQLIKQ
jgi:isoleucyl-tRNA synthetase